MSNDDQRQFTANDLRRSPQAHRLYRAAEQMAFAQKAKLSPDQWAQLLAALAAFGRTLFQIFLGGEASARESESPRESSRGEGPVMRDDEEDD